ncbi:MAG: L-seryl-tRNA(Sec) selenium transferase [Eubacteriales bacterium]
MSATEKDLLRKLPSVDEVLRQDKIKGLLAEYPRSLVLEAARSALEEKRREIMDNPAGQAPDFGDGCLDTINGRVERLVLNYSRPGLRPVINATGVVLHTNLGRALLSENARRAIYGVASGYANLELDLETGKRGSRYAPLEPLLSRLTGAEAALAVNNNAAAVLLALSTVAKGREVVVSRGQLVEIGGSFRIPEVMEQSGARLVEVGSTNKTRPDDYRRAVGEHTALLLHVHTSNYRIIGFTQETSVADMVEIGRQSGLPVMSDLGSGFLVDLSRYGLPWEPTVREVLAAGPDIVTFSGDKLLGGPQAGIIVGKRQYIDKMKKNPLTRAIRIDKLTVAAMEATLREYLDEEKAITAVPTLRMLTASLPSLEEKARALCRLLAERLGGRAELSVERSFSAVGGGAMPTAELPAAVVTVKPSHVSLNDLLLALRRNEPAVIGRAQDDRFYLDVRTIMDEEFILLADALEKAL